MDNHEQVENKKRKKEKKEKKNKKHKKEHVEETPVETNAVEEVATEPINVPIEENGHANGEGRKHKKKKHKKELDNQNGHEANGENENRSEENGDSELKENTFRKENNISLSGRDCEKYDPIESFASSPFSKDLLVGCKNFTKPTPIQAQCWPIITDGRDVVAIAETGSGKTLAFSLPVLQHIKDNCMNTKSFGKKARPSALVLSPTRELAMQIAEVCVTSADHIGIKTVCLYGGVAKGNQAYELSKKAQVVVATPGRLLDLLNDGALSLEEVSFLVLDEADRMLDLGFEKDIRRIISQIPPKDKRHTLMFSATWPQSIQNLANEFLNDPVKVTIGSEDLSANHRVTQIVEVVSPFDKDKRLEALLKEYHKSRKNRILIFALYKKEASRIEEVFKRKGWAVQAIHGDKNQLARTQALQSFKDGSIPLLIATDVAARGLDIPDVEYVINYTFPLTIEDYVHRIGRTGRAGKVGISHTFFTDHDKAHAGALMNVLREANQAIPEGLTKYGSHVKKKEHGLYGAFFKEVDTTAKAKVKKFDSED